MNEIKQGAGMFINERWVSSNKYLNWIAETQRKVDGCDYNHTIVCVNDDWCMHSSWEGKQIFKFDASKATNVAVFKPIGLPINHVKWNKLCIEHLKKPHKKYSFLGLANAGIGALSYYLFGKKIQLLKEEENVYCTELYVEILRDYNEDFYNRLCDVLGISRESGHNIITPCDLIRSGMFRLVEF